MRQNSQSRPWFARPAGSYLLLLTAIYAACLAPSAPIRQESHAVKAKILLSKLSIESRPAETASDLRTLLQDLLSLDAVHPHEVPVFAASYTLPVAVDTLLPDSPSPHALFGRPPPSLIL